MDRSGSRGKFNVRDAGGCFETSVSRPEVLPSHQANGPHTPASYTLDSIVLRTECDLEEACPSLLNSTKSHVQVWSQFAACGECGLASLPRISTWISCNQNPISLYTPIEVRGKEVTNSDVNANTFETLFNSMKQLCSQRLQVKEYQNVFKTLHGIVHTLLVQVNTAPAPSVVQ
ncbi:hypothetical protein MSG28_007083 [Choristoneura fumiferana]|uniref:Uncharacterized protein n=1 Tax=Choristoneura fumiferana TaxID=7141 RepID=A0ACC0JMS0_CHOFU|nr:hypothetical protein MSG28_007083 [Choristoneura fumiferana]